MEFYTLTTMSDPVHLPLVPLLLASNYGSLPVLSDAVLRSGS